MPCLEHRYATNWQPRSVESWQKTGYSIYHAKHVPSRVDTHQNQEQLGKRSKLSEIVINKMSTLIPYFSHVSTLAASPPNRPVGQRKSANREPVSILGAAAMCVMHGKQHSVSQQANHVHTPNFIPMGKHPSLLLHLTPPISNQ